MGFSLVGQKIVKLGHELANELDKLDIDERIDVLNEIRSALHAKSPMIEEPVDFVRWVRAEEIIANDYNPNRVAPPEMRLLEHSVISDGYTQPIVTWTIDNLHEVVDGFHRHRVGCENATIQKRTHARLPVTTINIQRSERNNRIAATIRHNRARGKHLVDDMSSIIVELKRRNWSDAKIGKELGMEQDEVLRLAQISGLAEMFADREFSEAWE